MADFETALRDPQGVYGLPKEVLNDSGLSREQKIQILRQWEYDAREISVADEENMRGDAPSMLNRVLNALHELEQSSDTEHSPPTKQGGQ